MLQPLTVEFRAMERVLSGQPMAEALPREVERMWAARFDELDNVIEELKQKEKSDGRKKRR
jgi:hypothetical protein